ncbi:unnamed protein product [Ectocarpus sp. 4 AP-2014]
MAVTATKAGTTCLPSWSTRPPTTNLPRSFRRHQHSNSWMALLYVMSAVSLMIRDFPGLRSRGSLKCPQHGDAMLLATKVTRPGDKFLEGSRCPQCSTDTRGLGAAAIDLVRMVDIRLGRDVIFREVKERFVDLKGRYSFSSPADSSKEEDLLIQKIDGVAIAVQGAFNEMKGEVDGIRGRLGDVKDEIKGGFHEMKGGLDDVQDEAPNYLYRRLVAVEEVASGSPPSRAQRMKRVLSKLRGVGKKEMVLHFLCPVDMTKVPCGYGGEGYRFWETRGWVKIVSPVLQVDAVTAKVALNATAGLNVNISEFLKDMKDGLAHELVD